MSGVLEELLSKRKALAVELGAALNGAAPQTKPAATVSGTRPTMSLAARKKLSLLAKARWAKKRKEEAKK